MNVNLSGEEVETNKYIYIYIYAPVYLANIVILGNIFVMTITEIGYIERTLAMNQTPSLRPQVLYTIRAKYNGGPSKSHPVSDYGASSPPLCR